MTPSAKVPENQLTTKEFSQRCGKPVATVQKWLRSGKLTGTKIGNRWYISLAELDRISAIDGVPSPSAKPVDVGKTEAEGAAVTPAPTYSVAEFSALTYLTEIGVQRWLKSGRLVGERASDGSWAVRAESLELPHLRHLIRS
jgi:excisionase family DNA binding protein